jgi:cell pole-organizing protein PopZ
MSDPMTNVQIEDVLSSIRRLVSEDHRPAYGTSAKADPATGKLVLTPALRIVPAPEKEPGEVEHPRASRAEMFSTVRKRAQLDPEHSARQEFGFDSISHEAAAAVLEAALSRRADDWEPDGSEVASGSVDWTIEWDADGGFDEVQGGSFAKPTVGEDAPVDWQDDMASGEADPSIIEPRHQDETFSVLEDEDDTIVDEETLREIVRDIIREELQGGLGERITRNVRKLVRAEIKQALATRDFE